MSILFQQLAAPEDAAKPAAGSEQGQDKLKVVFSHIAYDIFRLVAAFTQRMSEMGKNARAAVGKIDVATLSKSVHSSKVLHARVFASRM